ncbi:MAG: hypothetical protein M1821_000264 [Bathelium mastoideum]|nr:MAG: hypothetical protein M1821_000264 [Bathelium mastoideum]
MSGAELGLAIVATVDLCLKYSEKFIDLYTAFRHAEAEIAERITRFEASWLRTKTQLTFIQHIAPTLDNEFQNIQNDTLKVLANKLDLAGSKLESTLRKGEQGQVNRWKFARMKESLDKVIDDLEAWQRIFDPSWYLLMKVASPQINTELQKRKGDPDPGAPISSALSLRNALDVESRAKIPVFLSQDGLQSTNLTKIEFSSAFLGDRGSGKEIILDRFPCPYSAASTELDRVTRNIRNFARKLHKSDPSAFRLLNCKGVVKHPQPNKLEPMTFDFIFRVPKGLSDPRTLRSCLLDRSHRHNLSDRFQLATELAKSIAYVHTFGFVHKNLRPETILVFRDGESTIGSAFLIGFERVRLGDGYSSNRGDPDWEKNLYRHPNRRGCDPQDTYVMQHDIFSLGMCLLELGLWESFVDYRSAHGPGPSEILGLDPEQRALDAQPSQERSLDLTRNVLPLHMGTRFAQIVETCLTCLDEENNDFGDRREFEDEDGILVGSRYIEKILTRLAEIVV